MTYTIRPRGVCSRELHVEVDDRGIIQSMEAIGGCSGNLQGLGALLRGMSVQEAVDRMKGIQCGGKPTSCPDQLARGLEEILSKQ